MQLQEELKENTKSSDESLAVATSKLTTGKHRLEREVAKREQLQEVLNQLEEQIVSEKQQLENEHREEVEALKKSWDAEKAVLLDVIQRDCNQVFEKQRSSGGIVRVVSPRSVDLTLSPRAAKQNPCPETNLNPGHRLEASSYSKIDEELRETEALVQSLLLGGTSED